jgi:hypothetical protein
MLHKMVPGVVMANHFSCNLVDCDLLVYSTVYVNNMKIQNRNDFRVSSDND